MNVELSKKLLRAGLAAMLLAAATLPAAGAQSIVKNSGARMCAALTQADYASVGLHANVKPSANTDNPGSAYCVFQGRAGAAGGLEFDIFYPAGANPAEVEQTFQTTVGESRSHYKPFAISGADEALAAFSIREGGPPFDALSVRKGDAVFVLSVPPGREAKTQLERLSAIVLSRL